MISNIDERNLKMRWQFNKGGTDHYFRIFGFIRGISENENPSDEMLKEQDRIIKYYTDKNYKFTLFSK